MLSRLLHNCKTLPFMLLLLSPLTALAADLNGTVAEEVSTPTLPTITVEATRLDPLTGASTLDQEQIKKIPTRNSNTSDLLKLMPGVQMPENADSSNTAGEIAPAAVSISGGRPYDNNFLIDGVGNNSLLDPQSNDPSQINNVPGHPQEIFLLNNLIEEITVLRSNIPAHYGGFTGGVIDIKTIDPADTFGGNISYRASHSDWSTFHIAPENQDDFENSTSADYQPKFLKQNLAATLNLPINSDSAVVFNYSVLDSHITLNNLGAREPQNRRTENFFTKYKNTINDTMTLTLSGLYAPYTGDYYLEDVKDSRYTIEGGGYTLTGALENSGTLGDSELSFSINTSHNSRRGPDDWYNWETFGSKNWGPDDQSKEGGNGDIDKEQSSIAGAVHHNSTGLRLAKSIHHISGGVEAEHTQAEDKRLTETTRYLQSEIADVNCGGANNECIDGEQFIWSKQTYPEDHAEVKMSKIAGYLEDSIIIKRLTLRTGIRVDWDDYLNNTDFASRLSAGLDLFGNGRTTLIAGSNRYYGKNLLTLKLSEEKVPRITEQRGDDPDNLSQTNAKELNPDDTPKDWQIKSLRYIKSRITDLNTPYSDEWTVGLRQKLFKGLLELDYTDRQGHDLIALHLNREDNDNWYYEWSNKGRNHHQQANLSWSRSWSQSELSIAATWQETTGNSDTYSDSDLKFDDFIMYNGKVVPRDELLRDNFNRPFRGSIIFNTELFTKLYFSNITTYRSTYKAAEKIGTRLPDGTRIDIYEDVSNDHSLIFDWKFVLDVLQEKNLNLALTLDIYNVFDQKTHLGSSDTNYELGRQFWLGASCNF